MGTLTCHRDLYDECGYNPPICELSKPIDEGASPLQVLADRLIVGPPSIAALIDLLDEGEYIQEFVELVREYLPEHEREIMVGVLGDRANRFCQLFGEKYFELDSDMLDIGEEAIAMLVHEIPVRLMGLGYEDYHEFESMADGMVLMLALVANPWIEPEEDEEAARIPLLERVAELVGKEIAELIPKEGWDLKELHRRLDDTQYAPVAAFADWVWQSTGLALLDNCYEQMGCGWGGVNIPWDRETVDGLTEEWPKIRQFWDSVNHIEDWLRDKHQANYGELVDFLLGKERPKIPKEQLPLPLDDMKPKTLMEIFGNERLSKELTDDDILEANSF